MTRQGPRLSLLQNTQQKGERERPRPAAILLSPDNLYIFSLKQRRQIPFKLQRALHSHPENTKGNLSIPASHTESESTEANTLRPVIHTAKKT